MKDIVLSPISLDHCSFCVALVYMRSSCFVEAKIPKIRPVVASKPCTAREPLFILKRDRIHSARRLASMASGKLFSSQHLGASRQHLVLEALAMACQQAG